MKAKPQLTVDEAWCFEQGRAGTKKLINRLRFAITFDVCRRSWRVASRPKRNSAR